MDACVRGPHMSLMNAKLDRGVPDALSSRLMVAATSSNSTALESCEDDILIDYACGLRAISFSGCLRTESEYQASRRKVEGIIRVHVDAGGPEKEARVKRIMVRIDGTWNTAEDDDIRNASHAIAMDEHRQDYRPTLAAAAPGRACPRSRCDILTRPRGSTDLDWRQIPARFLRPPPAPARR